MMSALKNFMKQRPVLAVLPAAALLFSLWAFWGGGGTPPDAPPLPSSPPSNAGTPMP